MKTHTALPLFYALSMLFVSASSLRAQSAPAYPYNVSFTVDSASVTYDLNQQTITPDTIRGTIQDNSGLGSYTMNVAIDPAIQWVISTKIDGNPVQSGDPIAVVQGEVFHVEIVIVPYAEKPDTESYCLTLEMSPTYIMNHQCITLALTNNTSAVSTYPPPANITAWPNPAGSYLFVRGLTGETAGYSYEIHSVIGAEVRHGLLPADERINVRDLSSGAYRLLLFDSKGTLSNSGLTILH